MGLHPRIILGFNNWTENTFTEKILGQSHSFKDQGIILHTSIMKKDSLVWLNPSTRANSLLLVDSINVYTHSHSAVSHFCRQKIMDKLADKLEADLRYRIATTLVTNQHKVISQLLWHLRTSAPPATGLLVPPGEVWWNNLLGFSLLIKCYEHLVYTWVLHTVSQSSSKRSLGRSEEDIHE